MKKNNEQINLKDHSRFNRWIENLDEKDKGLTPLVRKSKWVLLVTCVFVLFGLSFIVFPTVKINSGPFEEPIKTIESVSEQTAAQSAFELPVDSFQNQLKLLIDEKISEKE